MAEKDLKVLLSSLENPKLQAIFSPLTKNYLRKMNKSQS